MSPSVESDPEVLLEAARSGDRSALARLVSKVERGGLEARSVSALTHVRSGNSSTIGITGAPGAGKSTLTSALVREMRAVDVTVGVLAIDPSSPFTGGAILGDRVRMDEHALDADVFIRSMATRGHLGGLSVAVPDAARVLDAAGLQWIIIETVGVGQVEVEIAGEADTTVVVVNPGWGDTIQANKAGLMEIADIFVINKADRKGVEDTRRDLEQMLELSQLGDWRPPIVTTVASQNEGIDGFWAAVTEHREHITASGELQKRRQRRLREELREIIVRRLEMRAREICTGDRWDELEDGVAARKVDPWGAADEMLKGVGA